MAPIPALEPAGHGAYSPRAMRSFLIGAGLFGILGLSVYFSILLWIDLGEVSLGWFGWLTMIVGSLMALALGGGLMALVFYSARRGHDEAHHDQQVFRRPRLPDEPEPEPDPDPDSQSGTDAPPERDETPGGPRRNDPRKNGRR
ncbi:MAG: hypothetical protein ACTS10_00910 [Kiloniellales bacterium]